METSVEQTQPQEEVKTEETATASLTQKEAVYSFTIEALANTPRPEGVALRDTVTKDIRKVVRNRLFAGMRDGSVKLTREMDDSKLKKYCSSMLNNWLKKDTRFA